MIGLARPPISYVIVTEMLILVSREFYRKFAYLTTNSNMFILHYHIQVLQVCIHSWNQNDHLV